MGKVRKKIGRVKNLRKLVSNRGYQKYLKAEGEGELFLDQDKIAHDEQWDGLHRIITNDSTSPTKAIELLSIYRHLWVIEESFRIQKHDLSVHPIYHFKPKRIEVHILICYLAFALIRYAEYREELQKEKISICEIRKGLWRTQASILKDHKNGKRYLVLSMLNSVAKKLYQTFGILCDQRFN